MDYLKYGERIRAAAKKGFAIAGVPVLRIHICARWKFSSPNEVSANNPTHRQYANP
jgi:hypothetical protein